MHSCVHGSLGLISPRSLVQIQLASLTIRYSRICSALATLFGCKGASNLGRDVYFVGTRLGRSLCRLYGCRCRFK